MTRKALIFPQSLTLKIVDSMQIRNRFPEKKNANGEGIEF